MRTPSIETLTRKVEKLEGQVSKLRSKETELAEAKEKLSAMSSPDRIESIKSTLEKKRAEFTRLEALLEDLESN